MKPVHLHVLRFLLILFLFSLPAACTVTWFVSLSDDSAQQASPVEDGEEIKTPEVVETVFPQTKIRLSRLQVVFRGRDGHYEVGSGCPPEFGAGTIENYHIVVRGVDTGSEVVRVAVAGDNSTLTWEWPCSNDWGLLAEDRGDGIYDIYIAPSEPSIIYTVLFFYADNSMALGMTQVR